MSIEVGSVYRLKSRPEEILFIVLSFEIYNDLKMGNGSPVYSIKGITTFGEKFEYTSGHIDQHLEKVA